jgi:hypothetical protein
MILREQWMRRSEASWQANWKKLYLTKLMKFMWWGEKPGGYVPAFLQAFWLFALHERPSGLASHAQRIPDGRD